MKNFVVKSYYKTTERRKLELEEKGKQFTQEFMQERNFNYMIISNRIKNYYKKMFNIEIINLFYKRKKKKSANQMVQQEN